MPNYELTFSDEASAFLLYLADKRGLGLEEMMTQVIKEHVESDECKHLWEEYNEVPEEEPKEPLTPEEEIAALKKELEMVKQGKQPKLTTGQNLERSIVVERMEAGTNYFTLMQEYGTGPLASAIPKRELVQELLDRGIAPAAIAERLTGKNPFIPNPTEIDGWAVVEAVVKRPGAPAPPK